MDIEKKILEKCGKEIFELNEIVKDNGGRLFIVGGFLRDIFIGRESKDIDVEIFGLTFEEILKIVKNRGKSKIVGSAFPIILYENLEISVSDSDNIEESALRRDFTINSLYFDFEQKKLYDFYGGVHDIKDKIIRVTNIKNIKEDPLRILRAFQFSARLGFEIEKESFDLMKKNLILTYNLPKERIFIEIEKILMKSKNPSVAFYGLKEIGWLKAVFPEIDILKDIEQGKKYHPEGDVFTHTMLAIDYLPIEKREIDVMFAILLHDIGKAEVENISDGDNIHFYGHDKKGAEMIKNVLGRVTENKDIIEMVEKLTEYHMHPLQMQREVTPKGVKKLASKVDFEKLMLLHSADMGGKGIEYNKIYIETAVEIYKNVKNQIKPLINGKDLILMGVNPGVKMGEYLKEIYEAQLDEQFLTYDDGIIFAKKVVDSNRVSRGG